MYQPSWISWFNNNYRVSKTETEIGGTDQIETEGIATGIVAGIPTIAATEIAIENEEIRTRSTTDPSETKKIANLRILHPETLDVNLFLRIARLSTLSR